MKVELSSLLATQTDLATPAMSAGESDLFAQELTVAQGIAGGVVPDKGPPDPGSPPGMPGVEGAVPLQPNAEEQEPDLQPTSTTNQTVAVLPKEYFLAASFVQGVVEVSSLSTETSIKFAPNVDQSGQIASPTSFAGTALDWLSVKRSQALPIQVFGHPISDGSVGGDWVATSSFSQSPGVGQEDGFAGSPQREKVGANPVIAQSGFVHELKGQHLEAKMVAALNPVALSVNQTIAPATALTQPSLQELISGLRPARASASPIHVNTGVLDGVQSDVPPIHQNSAFNAFGTVRVGDKASESIGPFIAGSALGRADTLGVPLSPTGSSANLNGDAFQLDFIQLGEDAPLGGFEDTLGPTANFISQPLSASKSVSAPVIPLPREVANEVVNQLIDRIQEMEAFRPNNQMVMKLNPEHLGAITVVLRTFKGESEAEITSTSEQVHQALDAARPAMQRTIEVKGVNLTSLSLHLGSESESAPQQGQPQDAQRAQQLFRHVPAASPDVERTQNRQYDFNDSSKLNLVI